MGNILFIPDGWSSNATVNETSTVTDNSAPEANLIDINPTRGCLSSISAQHMVIVLQGSSSDPIDSFCVVYTTTAANHTWRIEGAATLGGLGTSNLIDSGTMTFWPHPGLNVFQYRHAFWRAPAPQSCGAVRITITGLPQFFVGHVKAGLGFQPQVNFSFTDGFGFGWVDPSQIERPPSGPPQITPMPRYQSMRFNLNFQVLVDALTFVELSYQYGGSHPVFVVLDPDNVVWTHYIMMNALLQWDNPPVSSAPAVGRFQVPLTLTEYGP